MPYTYNGIGTHYYGRKNAQVRPGTCPNCHREVNLVSYDTILWFVVVFVPIIPLGRKRIIDDCPVCRVHRVASLKKWETAKQTGISSALEQYRKNPTPEAAIAAHRQLLGFHQPTEATALQKLMCEKFPDNAAVHLYLAQALSHFGRLAEAEPLFARALDLQPESPDARVGVALAMIRHGQLDSARQLLQFLDQPGASKLPGFAALEDLALAYQKAERHEEALQLFARLLSELPTLSDHAGFRKNVAKSEMALKRTTSVLPKKKFSLLGWFRNARANRPATAVTSVSLKAFAAIMAGLVAVLSIVFVVSNEYIRHHRTLFVVNQSGVAQQLEISGIGPVRLVHGVNTVKLPEGHYHAKFTGPVNEDVDFQIASGYWERCFTDPAWVLNPGGAAILVDEQAVYSENPQPGSTHFNYHYGQNFEHFAAVDHPFDALPERVSLDSGTSKTLTGLQLFTGKPVNAVYTLEHYNRHNEAANLAEWALASDPENEELLQVRLEVAVAAKDLARANRFLRAGLTNRPVHIEWHRTYQQLAQSGTNADALAGYYEDMLRAEPTNAALMYLAGRVAEDHQRAHQLFVQSHERDPASPYPLIAQAYEQTMEGNWPEAKAFLDQARLIRTNDEQLLSEWVSACVGAGKMAEAEKELRAWLAKNVADFSAATELCDILAAQGRRADGESVISNLVRAYRAQAPNAAPDIQAAAEMDFTYALGDFSELEKTSQRWRTTEIGKIAQFYAMVEQNRLDEASKTLKSLDADDPITLAAMYLASQLAGDKNQAAQWQKALSTALQAGNAKSRRAAGLIDGTIAPTPEAIQHLDESLRFKAIMVACLGAAHPELREQLNALARKLNVDRVFPYHLINRATSVNLP